LSFAAQVASILSEHRDDVYIRSPQESRPILKPAAAFLFVQLRENSFNLNIPRSLVFHRGKKEENAAFIMNGVYSFQFKLHGRLTFACIQIKTLL